ncbi:SprT family protein [Priestia koreensis]|uniref:SprT family protein n=1 Tax=Priestia koreensis TaxID=284581 RepID=UPI0028F70554|nr:SprT family protein [Priestia koreensis]
MDNKDLQSLTEEISIKDFHKPFLHRAYFNKRLKTTGGRYDLQMHNIEINEKHFQMYGISEVEGIIKHELCHYHLHIEGKGYKHRDQDFRELLKRVKAPRFCRSVKANNSVQVVHEYRCSVCQQVYMRRRRINTDKYVCGKCRGKLIKIDS